MAKKIERITELGYFLKRVVKAAKDYPVKDTVPLLASLITMHKDIDTPIEVFEVEGNMKRVAWVKINGTRYAFVFNHATTFIEVRKDSWQGETVLELNDTKDVVLEFETYFGKGVKIRMI